jgi:hypothetical protein
LLFAWNEAALASVAGSLDFVAGDVRIRSAEGAERVARKGDLVNVGDHIITGALSNAQLRMIDQAYLAVRPESELDIKDYQFSGRSDGNENAVLNLVQGTMRAFTGAITRLKREKFVMVTPTATIGIRGSGNVLHYSPNLGTLNHTIEGAHAVSSVNPQGQIIGTIVTTPGQTVQVFLNQPPVRVPTPPFLLQAATSQPRAPQQGQGQQQRQGQQGQQGTSGTATAADSGRASASPDTALTSASATGSTPVSTAISTATSVPPPVTTTVLTGTDPSGQTVNTTNQTTTTTTGQTTTIAATAVIPPPGSVVIGSYFYWPANVALSTPFGSNDNMQTIRINAAYNGVITDAAGNVTSAKEYDPGSANATVLTGTGGTLPGSVTTTANGISFGRWAGQTVAQGQSGTGTALSLAGNDNFSNNGGAFGPPSSTPARNVVGDLQWIMGPQMLPFLLPQMLSGQVSYSLIGNSPPTDQNGVTGTLGSATLNFNFGRQYVNAHLLNIVMPAANGSLARTWNAIANQMALSNDGQFSAYDTLGTNLYAHRDLSVSMTTPGSITSPQAGFGSIEGSLTGGGGNGAILAYNFGAWDQNNAYSHEHVNGTAAFASSLTQTQLTANQSLPYVIRLGAAGTVGGFNAINPAVSPPVPAFAVDSDALTYLVGGAYDPNRIVRNAQGQVIEYDSQTPIVSTNYCVLSGPSCSNFNVNEIGTRVSVNPSASTVTVGVPGVSSAATVLDFGSDSITGISWGRYANGIRAIYDRISGSLLGNVTEANGPHYILGPTMTGQVALPLSGSATYTLAGNTNPTDSVGTGHVGTLNSATLSANFSAQTVNASVNATVAGTNIIGSGANLPIQQQTFFQASKSPTGTGSLSMSCSGGSCNPALLSGNLIGVFTGTTGQGAAMAYSLNTGGTTGTNGVGAAAGQSISGVAAFRR